ncbi:predicted protein [Streptomyces viridosporus ATCC 14672]|uniref:Predicted protein n=1 Tax=Streptomyces viridosporus (strain ATCC 14672 / DSM 40746 / JCM 4963 / KCTC 9882 / NRRL B-12104 / FH 1290) TaxID=566461 RepID=D6A4K4_STRV1|nr:hypothetical protein [Streptomyces viridosporus]EFE65844.1 predicted protein [Streptomyces viridosporus ATCC 14672]
MNIEIKVDDITLSTIVADVVSFDEDGDTYTEGGKTVADLVAEQIVARLVKDDQWPYLREKVMDIRNEEIRAAVRPSIDEALARPIYKTNSYGERINGAETTLAEIIADEARKQLSEPADRYHRENGSILQQAVRAEVKRAFESEIADAVKQARDMVAAELGDTVSAQIAAAVKAGLKAK